MTQTNAEKAAFAEANSVYNLPHQFHTLHDVFAYAFSVGMPPTEMMHVRKTLYNARKKYPRDLRNWKAIAIYHHNKGWFEDERKEKRQNRKVDVIQIKRRRGDWVVRHIQTIEKCWHYALGWEDKKWENIIVHPDSRLTKTEKVWEKRLEQDPDYLEIT